MPVALPNTNNLTKSEMKSYKTDINPTVIQNDGKFSQPKMHHNVTAITTPDSFNKKSEQVKPKSQTAKSPNKIPFLIVGGIAFATGLVYLIRGKLRSPINKLFNIDNIPQFEKAKTEQAGKEFAHKFLGIEYNNHEDNLELMNLLNESFFKIRKITNDTLKFPHFLSMSKELDENTCAQTSFLFNTKTKKSTNMHLIEISLQFIKIYQI